MIFRRLTQCIACSYLFSISAFLHSYLQNIIWFSFLHESYNTYFPKYNKFCPKNQLILITIAKKSFVKKVTTTVNLKSTQLWFIRESSPMWYKHRHEKAQDRNSSGLMSISWSKVVLITHFDDKQNWKSGFSHFKYINYRKNIQYVVQIYLDFNQIMLSI